MKINKSELIESIRKLNKEKPLKEAADIQRTNFPADVDALEQHEEALKQNAERRDPKNYAKEVKDLIQETASEESRYRHFDVVDRKDLAKRINEAKEKGLDFKVSRSTKEGFRYDFQVLNEDFMKKEAGDPEVNTAAFNKATDIGASSPSTGLGEGIERILKKPGDGTITRLKAENPGAVVFRGESVKADDLKGLTKDSIVILDGEDKLSPGSGVMTTLKDIGCKVFAVTYKEEEEPHLQGVLKEEVKTLTADMYWVVLQSPDADVDDDVLYIGRGRGEQSKKDCERWVKELEERPDYPWKADVEKYGVKIVKPSVEVQEGLDEELEEELKVYTSDLHNFHPSEKCKALWDEIVEAGKIDDLEYSLEVIYPEGVSDVALDDMLCHEEDWIRDLITLPFKDGEENKEDKEEGAEAEIVDEFDDEEVEPLDTDVEFEEEEDIEPLDLENPEDGELVDDDEDIEPLMPEEDAEEPLEPEEEEEVKEEKPVDESLKEGFKDEEPYSYDEEPYSYFVYEESEGDPTFDSVEMFNTAEEAAKYAREELGLEHFEIVKHDDTKDWADEFSYNTALKEGEDKKVCPDCGKEICECDKTKDADTEEVEEIAEKFVQNNFKPNTLNESENKGNDTSSEIKQSLNEAEGDDEVVAVDDSLVENMMGLPSTEESKKE